MNREEPKRFQYGEPVGYPAALKAIQIEPVGTGQIGFSNRALDEMIRRHVRGKWGHRNAAHAALNERALKTKGAVVSCYNVGGTRVYLVTDLAKGRLHIGTEEDFKEFGIWSFVDDQNQEVERNATAH